jgi:hypothetical protein
MTVPARIQQYSRYTKRPESATFSVRNICGQSQLFIGLGEKFLGTLCVAAELTIIRSLGPIDFLVSVDDILLRGTQVAVPIADVHDWSLHVNNAGLLNVFNNRVLSEHNSAKKHTGNRSSDNSFFEHHGISPYK